MENDDDWTSVHDVGIMYVACAYRGDREMDDSERNAVQALLLLRFPEVAPLEASRIVSRVFLTYLSPTGSAMLTAAVHSLGQSLSRSDRAEIVKDLSGIASTDGLVYPAEADFITRVAREWQVSGPPSDS